MHAAIAACVVLAVLELVHPASSDAGAAGSMWVPLHVALIGGYGLLSWLLWRTGTAVLRVALIVFVLANTALMASEGLMIGLPAGTLLGNVTGAAWSFALLSLAAALYPLALDRVMAALLAMTWLVFVAGATPLEMSPLLSRATAIVTAAWLTYRGGPFALPSAVLVFAAVLRQHVGPEAALGLLCVGAAAGWNFRKPATAE
jgi:hypothetical protein